MDTPHDLMNLGEYLTVGEAARYLGVTAGTLRYWDKGGKVKAARHPVNGYRLYRKADLEALLLAAAGDREQIEAHGRTHGGHAN